MKPRKRTSWTKADEKLLVTLRKAKVPYEKIQQVLSRWRSIEALQSRARKLANPDRYVEQLAKQAVYNRNRHDRIKNGNEFGYHAQEWPEDARFGPRR